jgi:micrococcal nuclease
VTVGSDALQFAAAGLLLALILLLGPATACTVLSVGDGDSLRVAVGSQRLTIRLAFIDTPETV